MVNLVRSQVWTITNWNNKATQIVYNQVSEVIHFQICQNVKAALFNVNKYK